MWWQNIFWKGNEEGGAHNYIEREFGLWAHREGYLQFASTSADGIGAGQFELRTPSFLEFDRWYHVAVVIDADANSSQLYVDGDLMVEGDYDSSGIYDSSGPLRLGSSPRWDYHFNGGLDEFRMWDVARTQSDIQADMYGPLVGNEPGLLTYYDFNEAAGRTLFDQTINGNNAELGVDPTGNRIQANSIYANAALGIDLGNDGVTANDAADPDLGPNKLQNYPVIEAVMLGASTRVVGSVNSAPNTEFTLDFYANGLADPTGYGEGERWLGSTLVTTDAGGDATFDVVLPSATTAGEMISATATDPDGNTSEFSAAASYVPVAVEDAYLAATNTQLALLAASGVLANDYVAGSAEAVWVSGPSHGVLALQPDGSFVYDPALDFTGYDSFTYRAADGLLESDPATVSIFVATPLGPLDFRMLEGEDPAAGDVYYQWTTTHDAFLTLEAIFDDADGTAELALYNESCVELATSTLVGGNQRIDWQAGAGERYFLKLSGTNDNVDLRLANLVSHAGTDVTVYGTLDADLFEFDAAASRLVTINGVSYHFTDAEATSVTFDGADGADTAILTGNGQNETAELWPEQGTLVGNGYSVQVGNVETITAHGGGGVDLAFLHDDPLAKDTLTGGPDAATLVGNPYSNQVANFRYVHVYGTPGNGDEAVLQCDPNAQNTLEAWPDDARLQSNGFFLRAKSFDDVRADGTPEGGDVALLHDDPVGSDNFVGGPDQATLSGGAFSLEANSFRWVHVYGTAGSGDVATFHDDPARFDRLRAWPGEAQLTGEQFFLRAKSFGSLYANSTPGGGDLAQLYDSITDDTFTAWPDRAELSGDTFFAQVNSYRWVHGYSTLGNDVATLYGSDARDVFVGTDRFGKLRGTDFYNRAMSFGQLHVYGGGGRDVAALYDAVLETGVTQPVGMAQVAWLYEFERIRQRSDSGDTVTDATDQIFTAYWP